MQNNYVVTIDPSFFFQANIHYALVKQTGHERGKKKKEVCACDRESGCILMFVRSKKRKKKHRAWLFLHYSCLF